MIIPKLDKFCNQILVDTGQNYDENLRDIFFKELNIREPDYELGAIGSFGEQIAVIMDELEDIIIREKPDAFLVLGDTNSSLGAIMAKRLGVRVFHMEAGNRCYDDRVPEEVNRRIIDHSSDILMPYTERSRQNLLAEGIHSSHIFVTGNPIKEVLDSLSLDTKFEGDYYLATLHRQENVDDPERLDKFVEAFNSLNKTVHWSVHPRTRLRLHNHKLAKHVLVHDPMGLREFAGLEKSAYCVLTDSGTVQEECTIFGTPVVTLRDTTERPETIEAGGNMLSGCEPGAIKRAIKVVTKSTPGHVPPEYLIEHVSDTVAKIVLGYWR